MLSPADALAGFGSIALITLMGVVVLALLALVVGPLSDLIPNTPIVAILLPVIKSWCQRRGISPSRVLLPLSFATITGGTLTLIGTSTNLLAGDLAAGLGYGSFQLFSLHRHRNPRVSTRQRLSTAEQPLAARSRAARWH